MREQHENICLQIPANVFSLRASSNKCLYLLASSNICWKIPTSASRFQHMPAYVCICLHMLADSGKENLDIMYKIILRSLNRHHNFQETHPHVLHQNFIFYTSMNGFQIHNNRMFSRYIPAILLAYARIFQHMSAYSCICKHLPTSASRCKQNTFE